MLRIANNPKMLASLIDQNHAIDARLELFLDDVNSLLFDDSHQLSLLVFRASLIQVRAYVRTLMREVSLPTPDWCKGVKEGCGELLSVYACETRKNWRDQRHPK